MHDMSPADAARELGVIYSTAISALKRGQSRLAQNNALKGIAARQSIAS
jgi:hypothetical protein